MKPDTWALHFVGTLKDLYAKKKRSTDISGERKRRDREDAMRNYYDDRKLDIDEVNARSRAKELEPK
jgi:hypothetical protein